MKEKFSQFMYGRNGTDELSGFLSVASLLLFLLWLLWRHAVIGVIFWFVAVALVIVNYYRILSKDTYRRRAENAKYCALRNKVTDNVRNWWNRLRQSREYKFFRCPSCTAMLRVPRKKGKIRVTCRKCGNSFETKT